MASDVVFSALRISDGSSPFTVTHVGLTDWYLCKLIPPRINRARPACSLLGLPDTTVSLSACSHDIEQILTMCLMLIDDNLQFFFRNTVQGRVKEHSSRLLDLC